MLTLPLAIEGAWADALIVLVGLLVFLPAGLALLLSKSIDQVFVVLETQNPLVARSMKGFLFRKFSGLFFALCGIAISMSSLFGLASFPVAVEAQGVRWRNYLSPSNEAGVVEWSDVRRVRIDTSGERKTWIGPRFTGTLKIETSERSFSIGLGGIPKSQIVPLVEFVVDKSPPTAAVPSRGRLIEIADTIRLAR